jgi:hypothetical protein
MQLKATHQHSENLKFDAGLSAKPNLLAILPKKAVSNAFYYRIYGWDSLGA